MGKAAEAVEVFQVHESQGRGGLFAELPARHQPPRSHGDRCSRSKLLTQRAAGCDQDHPRSGLQRDQFFFRNFSYRAEINAAGLIHDGQVRLCFNEPAQLAG